MNPEHNKFLIALFNAGKLTTISADWFLHKGYAIICHSGRVVEIVEDEP